MDGQYTEARDIDSEINKQNENAITISLFQGCTRTNMKKNYIFSIHLLDSCNQTLKRSLLGVKKRLGHAQIDLL